MVAAWQPLLPGKHMFYEGHAHLPASAAVGLFLDIYLHTPIKTNVPPFYKHFRAYAAQRTAPGRE